MPALTTVRLLAGASARWRQQLAHRLTMEDEDSASDAPTGVAVWAARVRDADAVVSWRWVIVEGGIPVLADPLAIWSNIEFVDAHAQPLRPGRVLLELGSLVCGLPWQQRVPQRRSPGSSGTVAG